MPQKKKPERAAKARRSLREQAEKAAQTSPRDLSKMTHEDVQFMVRELEIHQIELETQNEELRKAQVDGAESLERYSDLYDFAPVGYVTFNKSGLILEGNLTAAAMLGVERQKLLRTHLSKFICHESQPTWLSHRQALFSSDGKEVCEVQMRRSDGSRLGVRIEGVVTGPAGNKGCRAAMIDITERKNAEEALNELNRTLEERVEEQTAKVRLQAEAIAHLSEGVVIAVGRGWSESKIVFVNDAVCRITGYSARELIGQWRKILQGKDTDRKVLTQLQRELAAGKSSSAELIQYRKDGKPYTAEVYVTPLPQHGGGPTTFVSVHRDITERKSVEEAQRESERRFRQMTDNAPAIIWTTGTDTLCTWVNKPWLEFTGRTLAEQLGDGWSHGIHPKDLEYCLSTYIQSFHARVPFTTEYRYRRHDGQWRWVLDNGRPLYHDNGTFAGYIGSCVDVTDLKQSEEALRERESRLQAVLNTAPDAIITTDERGIIIGSNPATERIFGYAATELAGKSIETLVPGPYRDPHGRTVASYLETSESQTPGASLETVARRKGGSTLPLELSVTAIPHLGLFTGVYRDISARRQTEQQLDQYRQDLRTMAAEVILAEERERQRIAEDLHDGFGQALFRARMKLDQLAVDDPRFTEVVAIIEEMGKMMNTMTFQLSPPVLRKLGLRAAVKSLARDMQHRYGLSVHIEDDGRHILLDERVTLILFRSIRELLINVAKHAHTNEARLSLRGVDGSLKIEVQDRGKGFNLKDQSHHVESGHFGLFSIRERMAYVGGASTIESAPGRGATVTLTASLSTKAAARSVNSGSDV